MYFFAEMTDTFGGEANYSWVRRFRVEATNARGAVWKLSRETGLTLRSAGDYGDQSIYDSKSGATRLFIEPFDAGQHSEHKTQEI